MDNAQKQEPKKTSKQEIVGVFMVQAGIEFAVLIAGPLIAGIFTGKWLDKKYQHNFFVIIGILLGLTVSCVAIYKRILDYKKMLDNNRS